MPISRRFLRAAGPVALVVVQLAAARELQASDPFYLTRLRAGVDAAARGDQAAAIRELRIACFGVLDEPAVLGQCLVELSLAQAATHDVPGFSESFRRLVEIEERFQGYSQAALTPERREAYEQKVVELVPPASLTAVPAFASLAERRLLDELDKLSPRKRRQEIERRLAKQPDDPTLKRLAAAYEVKPGRPATRSNAPAAKAPTHTAPPAAAGTAPGVEVPPAPPAPEVRLDEPPPLKPEPATPPATAHPEPPALPVAAVPEALSAPDRAQLEEVRRLQRAARTAADLDAAARLATDLADRHPANTEIQYSAAEIAYGASRFADAVRYFQRAGEPQSPTLLFYYAVSLYETGARAEAAEALRKCLPRVQKTPHVQRYSEKILGPAPPGDGEPLP
jgi:hypothetical protein